MDAVLSRLKGLSADELREEILKSNLKCGPITATTRAIFERKLARALVENAGVTERDSNGSSVGTGDSGSVIPAKQPPGATSAAPDPDADFGYGLGLNPPEEEGLMESSGTVSSPNVETSKSEAQAPSKTAETSPTLFYGVCPLWEDVLARNGKKVFLLLYQSLWL